MSYAMTLEHHAPVYRPPIYYPESDGKPVAETDTHYEESVAFIYALKEHFRENRQVYVAGNNFVYYEEGNRYAVFSPDVYTVHGVEMKRRRTYKLWEEGHAPSFVMELSSRSTWQEDRRDKMTLYACLGVREYFLYDPEADVLKPPLEGYRLNRRAGEYGPIAANSDGRIVSNVLGLTLWTDDAFRLHYADTTSGKELLRYHDQIVLRRRAERRHHEAARRADGEARRADGEARRADGEARRADEAAQRADEAAQRADAAERELARLRLKLER